MKIQLTINLTYAKRVAQAISAALVIYMVLQWLL